MKRFRKLDPRLAALALAAALAAAPAVASSHREAPAISTDPAADNTDVYFFRDPVDPSRLVLIGNWIPLEEPAGGPNFYHFEPNIRYEFNVDWDGDAIEDVVYRFTFTRNVRNGADVPAEHRAGRVADRCRRRTSTTPTRSRSASGRRRDRRPAR